jgi:hypothetical protein
VRDGYVCHLYTGSDREGIKCEPVYDEVIYIRYGLSQRDRQIGGISGSTLYHNGALLAVYEPPTFFIFHTPRPGLRLTDLFAPLEDIQPEVLGGLPSFRRFVVLQQHSLDIGFPCCGRFGGVDLDGVGLGG